MVTLMDSNMATGGYINEATQRSSGGFKISEIG